MPNDAGEVLVKWFVLTLAVLALAGCGGGDEQAKPVDTSPTVKPIDWPHILSMVEKQVVQRSVDTGKGHPSDLYCYRDDWISPKGNTEWHCSFTGWYWDATVARDGRVLWFAFSRHTPPPTFTPEQKPWAYWTGYTWCRKYRDLSLGSLDDVGGDYYRASGESSTLDVQDEGCEDGFLGNEPAVPRPEGFRLTGVSPVQDFE